MQYSADIHASITSYLDPYNILLENLHAYINCKVKYLYIYKMLPSLIHVIYFNTIDTILHLRCIGFYQQTELHKIIITQNLIYNNVNKNSHIVF